MALRTLKVLRVAANLTQDELADRMDLDRSTISKYESGDLSVPQAQRHKFVGVCSPRIDWNKLRKLAEVARESA
jgi:predicted transcriptional regulator